MDVLVVKLQEDLIDDVQIDKTFSQSINFIELKKLQTLVKHDFASLKSFWLKRASPFR